MGGASDLLMEAEKLPTTALVMHDGYAKLAPRLQCELSEEVAVVTKAISDCEASGGERLLVDIRELTGFPSPTVAERYDLVTEWARASAGRVRMAMVARPEMIDPEMIGITIARNRFFHTEIFVDEQSALEWLMD